MADASVDETQGDPLATIGRRIGARVIDWLVLLMVTVPIGLASVSGDPDATPPTWAILSTIGIIFFYETLGVAWRGQTLGKFVVGIELVNLATGDRPSFLSAALRAVPIVVLLVLLQQFAYIAMVFVYFSAAFMKHQRGLLDRLAGTVVIQGRRPGLLG